MADRAVNQGAASHDQQYVKESVPQRQLSNIYLEPLKKLPHLVVGQAPRSPDDASPPPRLGQQLQSAQIGPSQIEQCLPPAIRFDEASGRAFLSYHAVGVPT